MIRRMSFLTQYYEMIRNHMMNELNSRGIFTNDRVVTMQRRLTQLDYLKPQRPQVIPLSLLKRRHARSKGFNRIDFDSRFLANELRKIDQGVDTRGMNKKKILHELDKRLKGENTLIGLISKYKAFKLIPTKELIQCLKRYVSPFEIEHNDLYYLLCTRKNLKQLIHTVMKDIDSLSLQELGIFLMSVNTFFNTFNKIFTKSEPEFPIKALQKVLKFSAEHLNTCNFYELMNIIEPARKLHPQSIPETLHLLQIEMVNHPLIPEYLDNKDLVKFLANLPASDLSVDLDIIAKYFRVFESRFNEFWIGDLVEVFLGIHRAGLKVSDKLRMGLEDISLGYLETVKMYTVINLFKGLSESGCLSEYTSNELIEWFELEMRIKTKPFQSIADMCYTVHKYGYTSFLIKEPNPLLRLMNPYALMDLQSMLKFSIVFAPFLTFPDFFPLVIRTFKRIKDLSKVLPNVFPLVLELQSNLLNFCQEEPIFNYQLESTQNLFIKEKNDLINYLHKIIVDYQPEDKVKFQYFSEFAFADRPSEQVFGSLTQENLFFACKALWRFRIDGEVGDRVGESALPLLNPDDKINTQIIYYIATVISDKQSIYLDHIDTKSEFYLALCYELGLTPNISDDLLANIRHSNLVVGEILIKTLLVAIKSALNKEFIKKLTRSLPYYPKNHPNSNVELKKLLVKELIKDKDLVDFKAFSIFIEQIFESFNFDELKEIFEFLGDNENISDDIKEYFARVGLGKTNSSFCYPDICIKDVREISDSMEENRRVLEKMIEGKVYAKHFFNGLMGWVRSGECRKEELRDIMPKMLEFLSNFGNFDGNFEVLAECLKNYELLEALTQNDIINLLYLDLQSNCLPSSTIQILLPSITPLSPPDPLKRSEDLSLNFYPSFTYTTTYEPRYIKSNNSSQTCLNPAYIEYFPTSFETFISNLKHVLVLQHFNIDPSLEISQSVNCHLIKFTKTNFFLLAFMELKKEQDMQFGLKFKVFDRDLSQTQLSSLGNILACFKDSNKAILMIDQECFASEVREDKTGEANNLVILSPVTELSKYAERLTGLEIECFNMRMMEKKIYDPKYALSFLIHKRNPYY